MEAREAGSSEVIRSELIALLTSHNREVEEALVARFLDTDLGVDFSAEDVVWLRPVAAEALSALISGLEEGDRWTTPLPPSILAQIRYMARRGMSLESTLRGFAIVGNVVFEFFAERFDELPLSQEALRYAMSWQSWNNDRLMNAFAAEYEKEVERLSRSPSRHLVEQVEGLLEGRPAEGVDLGYRLDACHVGVIAFGDRAELECRRMAESLGCDLLSLARAEETEPVIWAWFGSRTQIRLDQLEQLVVGKELSLAAGEPRQGLPGWRLSHQEAQAALTVATLEPPRLTRYSDIALVADALRNEATGRSLIDRYLSPLDQHRDAERLRNTVRTYLDLDCNAASTASALSVNRHTVQRRLKKVEKSVGEPLSAHRAQLDVALQLERLTARAASL